MKKVIHLPLILLIGILACSKPGNNTNTDTPACAYSNDPTILQLENRLATITQRTPEIYSLILNSSDTILTPCSIPASLRVNNMEVNVSGDIKPTAHNAYDPCKCYNFVIRNILKK